MNVSLFVYHLKLVTKSIYGSFIIINGSFSYLLFFNNSFNYPHKPNNVQ